MTDSQYQPTGRRRGFIDYDEHTFLNRPFLLLPKVTFLFLSSLMGAIWIFLLPMMGDFAWYSGESFVSDFRVSAESRGGYIRGYAQVFRMLYIVSI